MTLSTAGYQIDSAMSAMEARRKLEADHYDVLLLDVMMPEVSGFDLLTQLNESGMAVPPVIFLTARKTDQDRETGEDLGAVGYLTKPATRGDLLELDRQSPGLTPGEVSQPKRTPAIHRRGSLVFEHDPVLFGVVHGPGFADHGDLDLPGVLHPLFDLLGHIACQTGGVQVVDVIRLDDDPDLPAGLQSIAFNDALEGVGDVFQTRERA